MKDKPLCPYCKDVLAISSRDFDDTCWKCGHPLKDEDMPDPEVWKFTRNGWERIEKDGKTHSELLDEYGPDAKYEWRIVNDYGNEVEIEWVPMREETRKKLARNRKKGYVIW